MDFVPISLKFSAGENTNSAQDELQHILFFDNTVATKNSLAVLKAKQKQ